MNELGNSPHSIPQLLTETKVTIRKHDTMPNMLLHPPANLQEYEGDVLVADVDVVAQQTNAMSKGASGLAFYLFEKWPEANTYGTNPEPRRYCTTDFIKVTDPRVKYVANMCSQLFPGHASWGLDSTWNRVAAFEDCLVQLGTDMIGADCTSVAFPKLIGCGLAGGNWAIYSQMINKFAKNHPNFTVHIVEKK